MKVKGILTILILMAAIIAAPSAHAVKPIKFGVRAGIQTQNLGNFRKATANGTQWPQIRNNNMFGFEVAAMSRISFLGVFVQPELAYSHNRFDMDVVGAGSTRVKISDLNVPILVGTKFLFVNVFAGPVFNLMTETNNSRTVDIITTFRRPAAGYQIGAGVELLNINLDLRYGGNFSKPEQTITWSGSTATAGTRMNGWTVNLGYFF